MLRWLIWGTPVDVIDGVVLDRADLRLKLQAYLLFQRVEHRWQVLQAKGQVFRRNIGR